MATSSDADIASESPITVLHVDDDSQRTKLTATLLEKQIPNATILSESKPDAGLARLEAEPQIDCIVSDYDMGSVNGLDFLEMVRESYPDLPFILFTGKGSEEIASEAISAGVSDYLQKKGGAEQYEVLANRVENVVAQHRAEREAERSRERIQTVYERVTDAFFALDTDWRFTYVNSKGEELIQRTESELLGNTVWEAFPAAVDSKFEEEYRRAMETQEPTSFESYFEPLSTRFEVHAYPSEEGLSVYFRDVTDQEAVRQQLHREKELLEQLLETSPVGILVLDPEGGITRANERTGDLLELSDAELTGRRYDSTAFTVTDVDGDPLSDDQKMFARVMDDGEEILGERIGYETPEGTRKILAVSGAPIYDEKEGVERVILAIEDVTDHRERERELERKNTRLERFASVVSHDLRNPLDIAQTRTKLAREEVTSEESGVSDEHLAETEHALGRMDDLIEDVLALSRQGEVVDEQTSVPLAEAVESAASTVELSGVRVEVADGLPAVEADAERLRTLFENLLSNCVEHARDGTERANGDRETVVRVGTLPNQTGFYVADDGSGIPESERERVFDHGYTTATDGTGFGLTIVQSIVDAHDWTVEITDSETGGARFEIAGVEEA